MHSTNCLFDSIIQGEFNSLYTRKMTNRLSGILYLAKLITGAMAVSRLNRDRDKNSQEW